MHYIRSKATLIVTFLLASKLFLGCDNINSNNIWTSIEPLPLDQDIEKQIDEILPRLTLEQKVGQVIQGDSDHVSPEDVSVLGKMPDYVNVVSPVFKDCKNGKYKIISFYAKKARGLMARWIIENNVKDFEELSGFNSDGYYYSKAESTATEPVFLRD